MKFAAGDKIVMSEKSKGRYAYTVPGVYGTIVRPSGFGSHDYLVMFENNPITNPKFHWRATGMWNIEERFMELVQDFKPQTLEERVCSKIKQLDLQWALKQKMKRNKVCDALHVTVN